MKKLLLIVFLVNSLCGAELIFKSAFEDGVNLLSPDRKGSANCWWQELEGSDSSGFSWPIELQGEEGQFQMIVDSDDINRYVKNEIIETNGIDNKKTRVLHQTVKEKEHTWTQDPYVVHIDKEQKKLYLRYSLKFPKNLKSKLGKDGWLTFFEFKTKSDYRVAIYVYEGKDKKLYWYAHGDNVVLDDRPYKEFWSKENKDIEVPTDKWFDVEIFWNRSKGDNGRVWMAIDGEEVIDYQGSTKLDDAMHQIMLFTNYSNAPIEQWVDNVEVWSDYPCGEGKSCHESSTNSISGFMDNAESMNNFFW